MKKKTLKKLPVFKNEEEEFNFWATQSPLDYLDTSTAKRVVFPNLKPSTKTISLRLTESLLDRIKMIANKKDVPYQSLMKIMLDEAVRKELDYPKKSR
jgi:predicted DNA binding CopG/RHH family protein